MLGQRVSCRGKDWQPEELSQWQSRASSTSVVFLGTSGDPTPLRVLGVMFRLFAALLHSSLSF